MAREIVLGPFQVDLTDDRLLRDGVDLALRPQAFRAFKVLIQNRGQMVHYDQLIRDAWGMQVSKHTVATTVNEIKSVLAEYGSWITCRAKIGYLLALPKSEETLRRGWHFWNQFTHSGFENALQCFRQVADLDSADFRAHQAIGSTHLMLASFLLKPPCDVQDAFFESYNRAASLGGLTVDLRLDRAYALVVFERKFAEAETELLALREECPTSVHVHMRLALLYLAWGKLENARAATAQGLASDELSPLLGLLLITTCLFCREFHAAVESGKASVNLHPGASAGRAFYAEALAFDGRTEEALMQFTMAASMSPETNWIKAGEGWWLATLGRTADAAAILEKLQCVRQTQYVDAYPMALLLDALGKQDEALLELDRASREKSYSLLFAGVDAKADGLRRNPALTPAQRRLLVHARRNVH